MVIAVSAIARFTTARSRFASERDRLLARSIWFAAWFQWTLAFPSQKRASAVSSSAGQSPRRLGPKLGRAWQHEGRRECQPLRAHRPERRRRRSPLAQGGSTGERRVVAAE